LLANCLHLLSERGGKTVTVSTGRQDGICVLQIAAATAPLKFESPSNSAGDEDSLSLSACQGILQEHRGQISRELSSDGSVLLRVELPASDLAPARTKSKDATVPVLWQSRPYA